MLALALPSFAQGGTPPDFFPGDPRPDAPELAYRGEYGVGVQTVAAFLEDKKVYAGCDTLPLPGFQGVTPLEFDCGRCGECYLNDTGGICPITACSKSLVNGQCGGSKNGKCEVDKDMDCGWERIYRKLEKLNKLDTLKHPVRVRNFNHPDADPQTDN